MKIVLCDHIITCAQDKAKLTDMPCAILVDGEKIVAIGAENDVKAKAAADVEVINLKGKYVLPGMIDAHLHLSFSSSTQPVTELVNDSDDEILLREVRAAQMELRCGVTTVRDSGARGMSILKLRDFIRQGLIEGADIISAGMPITTTGGHCNFCGLECDSTDDVRKAVRMLCKNGVDYIKVMVSGGNMTPGSASTITQYNLEQLTAIVEEAHCHGKMVSGHVHTVQSIGDSIIAGFDTLEHCSFKAANGDEDYREDLVQMMLEKGTVVCPGFSKSYVVSAEEGAPQPDKVAMWDAFKTSRFKTTSAMWNSGVPIIAGTDAGCKNTKFDEFWKILPLLEEKIGMTKEETLLACTSRSAKALGYEDQIGSLEEGKLANIIAVDADPLNDLAAMQMVSFVMKRGKTVAL